MGPLIFHAVTDDKEKESDAGSLFAKALAIAKGNPLEELHIRTGLRISWLRKFRGGEIKDPSVNKVEVILKAFDSNFKG